MLLTEYTGSCYIHHEYAGSGFSSIYLATLSAIVEVLGKNLKPYIDSNKSWFNPTYDFKLQDSIDKSINPWEWWFDQDPLDASLSKYESYLNYIEIKHPPHEYLEVHNNETKTKYFQIAQKYTPIKKHIQDKIDKFYNENLKDHKVLGVLTRGTEMYISHNEYKKLTPEEWPLTIEDYLTLNPGFDTIFLGVCEDYTILNSILNHFKDSPYKVIYIKDAYRVTTKVNIYDFSKGPWYLNPEKGDLLEHRKKLGEDVLIATHLLAKCEYFMYTYSTMATLTLLFNNQNFKQITPVYHVPSNN
jgi:hypothetical protein